MGGPGRAGGGGGGGGGAKKKEDINAQLAQLRSAPYLIKSWIRRWKKLPPGAERTALKKHIGIAIRDAENLRRKLVGKAGRPLSKFNFPGF